MTLFNFIRDQWRLIALGLVLNFFSSSGQTYFISVFSGEFRAAFGLTHGSFGLLYSIATLGGALLLIWLGRYIDRVDLRWFAAAVCTALALAALSVSVAGSALALALSVVALRLTGQGLMTHTAVTTVSRYLEERRGTAVGFIASGITIGAAVFPVIGVALISGFGWRQGWMGVGIFYLVVVGPLVLWLLKGQGKRHAAFLARHDDPSGDANDASRQRSLTYVVHDPGFYLVLPAFMAPTVLFTGFIFHQVHLVETKGWTLVWFTSGMVGYAVGSMLTAMALGPFIDRFTASRILPWYLIPFAAAMLLIWGLDQAWMAPVLLVTFGIGVGAFYALFGTLWAELYGVRHLGAIRSLTQAVTIFASAISPALFGWLIDGGLSMERIALYSLVYIAVGTGMAALAPRYRARQAATG